MTGSELYRSFGICEQAQSNRPDFPQFLAEEGIDSISLSPDTVLSGMLAGLKAEA